MYKVKEIAEISGVSVRTLHHYDEIGLLKPESVNSSGYRFYGEKSLSLLQEILFLKELNFDLKEIQKIIYNSAFDKLKALKNHQELLIKKKQRLEQIILTVEKSIKTIQGENTMTKKEMFNGFDMKEIEEQKNKYAEEAKQRWGHTDAYKESIEKTSKYKKEDWAKIKETNAIIYQKLIANMSKGINDEEVQNAVEELRQSITDNFYNCTPEIFRGLAHMYVDDERFTKNIDVYQDGLAEFLSKAMIYYCDNLK